ncbi:hypothetical protein K0M31_007169 [Melipona bicolor]|uniref:Uncharacterized protein n=1 Tax=Melipona bicolor TaxID=60889 RepID=A0AA40FRR2_9HYME|nr:hypothetical protein K0M31_007169 [Melipona bicolor]
MSRGSIFCRRRHCPLTYRVTFSGEVAVIFLVSGHSAEEVRHVAGTDTTSAGNGFPTVLGVPEEYLMEEAVEEGNCKKASAFFFFFLACKFYEVTAERKRNSWLDISTLKSRFRD